MIVARLRANSAAADPEGLNTTLCGAIVAPLNDNSAAAPESIRRKCSDPSAATATAESSRGATHTLEAGNPRSIGPPITDAPGTPTTGRRVRPALSNT